MKDDEQAKNALVVWNGMVARIRRKHRPAGAPRDRSPKPDDSPRSSTGRPRAK